MTEVKREIVHEYKSEKKLLKGEYKEKKRALKNAKTEKERAYCAQTDKPHAGDPPKRSVLEEVGNAITHGVGALFAVAAYVLMLIASDGATDVTAATVYFVGMFLAFTMSCLYHSFRYGSRVKRVFRRLDYCSIYLLIGATFAPLLLCYIGGAYGLGFFIAQWTVIALGITLIGVFGPMKLRKLHMVLYFLLGWSALAFIPQMLAKDIAFFLFVLAGGVIYSLGVIPFAIKKKSSHFIWHFFVLAGAAVQWLGIYLYLYL